MKYRQKFVIVKNNILDVDFQGKSVAHETDNDKEDDNIYNENF